MPTITVDKTDTKPSDIVDYETTQSENQEALDTLP